MIGGMGQALLTVEEAGRALGISRSTVWRRIRMGQLPTVRRGGRRLIVANALRKAALLGSSVEIPAFTSDHPMFRLIGAGRGGGSAPGARDKHAILDE